MLKIDLHIHTSDDPIDHIRYSVYDLIDVAEKRGFNALAVTNHTAMSFSERSYEYAAKKGILLLKGIECSIEDKHVVVINPPDESVEKVQTFKQLAYYKRTHQNIFVFAPHPYYPKNHCLNEKLLENIDLFDGIEYSHCYLSYYNSFNLKAEAVAEQYGKAIIGTSDMHHLCQFNRTYTMVEAEQSVPAIIEALKAGRVQLCTEPISLWALKRIIMAFAVNYMVHCCKRFTLKPFISLFRRQFKKLKAITRS